MGFGPPPVDVQRIVDQLVAKGVPPDQAQQMAQQMANSINGISQSGENKAINTALPIAGAAAAPFLGGGGAAAASGAGTDTSGAAPGGNSSLPSWLTGLGGVAGDIGSFLKNNSGGLLSAAGIAEAALRDQQANNYAKQALSTASDAYNAKAPLRALGIAGLQNAGRGNPFATRTAAPLPLAGGPGPSPTDVLNQQGANAQSGGPPIPRQGPVAAPTAPPNFSPSAPMRLAGY